MDRYRLQLIGPFGLFAPSGGRIEITSKKGMALMALLGTAPSGERSRRWLQTMLWGSRQEEQAQASLRREISTLAKQLGAEGSDQLLRRSSQRIGLNVDRLSIDVDGLGMHMSGGTPRTGCDFLEGLDLRDCEAFEDWLRDERERVRDMLAVDIPEPRIPLPSAEDILGDDLPTRDEVLANDAPKLPPKPSLVVIPFEELSSAGDGWLGMGIADEIGVILSQFPQLFIVASASARALANKALPHAEIARRLGVRYLLNGVVLQLGDRLKVSPTLVDAGTGEQVWASTFYGTLSDLFELQEQIARQIAPQIWTRVDMAERSRVLRAPNAPADGYETYWRANALFRNWDAASVNEAIVLSERLVTEDATCPWATSLAAYCHSISYLMGYAEDREQTLRSAILRYQMTIRHGEDNVEALGYLAGTLINIRGDLSVADRLISHALDLLPAHQPTLFWGGWVDIASGDYVRAQMRFELALRINPASGMRGQTLCGIGMSLLFRDDPESAYAFLREACHAAPGFPLAEACLQLAARSTGRLEVAAATQTPRTTSFDFIGFFRTPERRSLPEGSPHHPNSMPVSVEKCANLGHGLGYHGGSPDGYRQAPSDAKGRADGGTLGPSAPNDR